MGRACDEHEGAGFGVGAVDGFDSGHGGFAPLAGAVEDAAAGFAAEGFDLHGVEVHAEADGGEVGSVGDGLFRWDGEAHGDGFGVKGHSV